ncbi:tRNA lysidine(34) synthetase TilS [Mediterraneibacter glycyrrhizinilyticus]
MSSPFPILFQESKVPSNRRESYPLLYNYRLPNNNAPEFQLVHP